MTPGNPGPPPDLDSPESRQYPVDLERRVPECLGFQRDPAVPGYPLLEAQSGLVVLARQPLADLEGLTGTGYTCCSALSLHVYNQNRTEVCSDNLCCRCCVYRLGCVWMVASRDELSLHTDSIFNLCDLFRAGFSSYRAAIPVGHADVASQRNSNKLSDDLPSPPLHHHFPRWLRAKCRRGNNFTRVGLRISQTCFTTVWT